MSLQASLRQFRPVFSQPAGWLCSAWVLVMVGVPIALRLGGEDGLRLGVVAGVLLQFLAVMAILLQAWGIRRTMAVIAVVLPLTWAIEFLGSNTGLPFGSYRYTGALRPQLGHVPLLIPLAWLMMLPPAWAVSAAIVGERRRLAFVLVSALAFTAWDLFLDPQMVRWGYWVWTEPGLYFGIPLVNFAGWVLASALVTLAVQPRNVPMVPLVVIYSVTWALQFVGQLVFWQMPGPALVGGAAMGVFLLLAWQTVYRRWIAENGRV